MASNSVSVNGVRYKLTGAMAEAFRYQVDATGWAEERAEEGDETAKWVIARRDAFLKAMPPRVRWLLIQSCLELAAQAAAVQESKSK